MNDELTIRVTMPKTVRTPALDAAAGRQARLSRRGVVVSEDVDEPTIGRYTPAQRALAIAHAVERAIESGVVKNYTDAAARLGVTKARVLQLARLLALPPTAQEAVLLGKGDVSVRELERVAAATTCHAFASKLSATEKTDLLSNDSSTSTAAHVLAGSGHSAAREPIT